MQLNSRIKALISIFLLFCLCACDTNVLGSKDSSSHYSDLIELVSGYSNFVKSSEYFDIAADVAKIDEGYRYYVTIDNPHYAMYDIEAIAIESGVDYSDNMAANAGVFEDIEYHMVPNQFNASKGYVEGLVISGLSSSPNITLYVLVQWKNEDFSNTRREFIQLDAAYEG